VKTVPTFKEYPQIKWFRIGRHSEMVMAYYFRALLPVEEETKYY
jgi:hypothetical protein